MKGPAKFANYLARHGIEQKAVAEACGVKPVTVWRWLNGRRTPNTRTLLWIQKFTGGDVMVDDWIG